MKEEVCRQFSNKFMEMERTRLLLEGISFNKLSREESLTLENPFLEEEIEEAIWNCGNSKSLGPDG